MHDRNGVDGGSDGDGRIAGGGKLDSGGKLVDGHSDSRRRSRSAGSEDGRRECGRSGGADSPGSAHRRTPRKLILDLDTGIDDALAIAYALASPEVDLIAVTGTYGNVTVERGLRNSLAVLDLLGADDVPVYAGIDHPLGSDSFEPSAGSRAIHGDDGLGGASIPESSRRPETQSAQDAILNAAATYGRDLLVVPTGALTTVAHVCCRCPEVMSGVGSITFMGGALTVPGNVNPCVEANISQDPQSADNLFHCAVPTTMVGLDVTHRTVLTRDATRAWRSLGTRAGRFFADMVDYYIGAYERSQPYLGGCGLHDPLAVAAAIDPTLISTIGLNLQVDLEGPFRGRTIADPELLREETTSTRVAVGVDGGRFVSTFVGRVGRLLGERC
ncbi:nucleoside hydrolase [uncultured Bifidobacterium sp.]|uniref:nucleoside hydrolase n=1 Tax=uncultured Bifidobacterium sp. TaxID=165187 RepID=UPI002637C0DD|nr:nucleoside hydrolase [uncultured Bifidobacterium sp.]